MIPFFSHLIERTAPSPANVMPRLRSRYEPDEGSRGLAEEKSLFREPEFRSEDPANAHDGDNMPNGSPGRTSGVMKPRLPRPADTPAIMNADTRRQPLMPSMDGSAAHAAEGERSGSGHSLLLAGDQGEIRTQARNGSQRESEDLFPPEKEEGYAGQKNSPGEKIFPEEKGTDGTKRPPASGSATMNPGLLPGEMAWLQRPPAPVIKVTIGRIEVKAAAPAAPPVREKREKAGPPKPRLSLDEFLNPKKNPAS